MQCGCTSLLLWLYFIIVVTFPSIDCCNVCVCVGEKTEEFENLCGDMQEVKYLYKDQIEQLMNIVAPCSSAVTAVPNTD